MAAYPSLGKIDSIADPSESTDEETSDEGEMVEDMLGFSYDEYGQLIQTNTVPQTNLIQNEPNKEAVATPATYSNAIENPLPEVPNLEEQRPVRKSLGSAGSQKAVLLKKDSSGKLGIRVRRMGQGIYLSFVEKGSAAANQGIGFGDQIINIQGVNLLEMTGTSLMRWISRSKSTQFHMVIKSKPYDFNLVGERTSKGELSYSTPDGNNLGVLKLEKVQQKGHIKHLQLIELNGKRVLGLSSKEIAALFREASTPFNLRVMPRIFVNHLFSGLDKEKLLCKIQFSPASR